MLSFWTILSATAPVFLIIGLGCLMRRRNMISDEVEVGAMRLALNLFVPCLILSIIPGNPALSTISSAVWAIGSGFVLVIVGFMVAGLVGWMVKLKTGQGLRTFAIAAGIQNYGYLPVPIIAELFSEKSGPMGLVFVYGIGIELAMWSVGLIILTKKTGWKSVVNGPFIVVIAALFLNYSGGYTYIPKMVSTSIEMLGRCAIPLSIFMIGSTIGSFFKKGILSEAWKISLASVVTRMVILTAIFLCVAKYLPMIEDLKTLLVIQAAMPAAVFPIILARMYGGSPTVAIQVVLATSIVSVVTSPFVISIGLAWIAAH